MRIANLHVENFLGVRMADVALAHPVHLFAGSNFAGKSSLRDAIALALTADLGRVSMKKEAAQLIHEGAEAACCEVIDANGEAFTVTLTAAGKITDSQKGRETDPALAYALDGQRFALLDDTGRRAMLFALTGTKVDTASVKARLAKRGCDAAKLERIAPLLRAGMDAASKDAKSKATEAKGAWRAITGETYGSEKAKTWKAPVPEYDAKAATDVATELKHIDVAIGGWNQTIGALQAEQARRSQLQARLPALSELADKVHRIETKLTADKRNLSEAELALQLATAAAGQGVRAGLVHDLAQHLYDIARDPNVAPLIDVVSINGTLTAYECEHGPLDAAGGDPEAMANLPAVRSARELMERAVAHSQRDLAAALQARDELQAITAELAEPFDSEGLAGATAEAEKLQATRAQLLQRADTLKAAKSAADAAEKKTSEAAKHAADVASWDQIGDALSPDGIPAEILADALGPVNDRLGQAAADTEWPRIEIGADMSITAALHERPYRLMSESEKWRADAMIAEAIAHLSGVRLLVLDRFDVLDLKGRSELLGWLDVLAANGEIDTALVFGTLKGIPANLPATIGASWVEAGVVRDLKAAA